MRDLLGGGGGAGSDAALLSNVCAKIVSGVSAEEALASADAALERQEGLLMRLASSVASMLASRGGVGCGSGDGKVALASMHERLLVAQDALDALVGAE